MDLIIGAGISGLSYAAFTQNEYLVVEKSSEVGGYCKTICQDGFTWDYSGHFFHSRNANIKDWLIAGICENELMAISKQTQIKYKNRNIDYPFQSHIHQLDKDDFIDCLYDLFNNPFTSYLSFKEMLYCKFGQSIAEKFLIPYNEKLYACNLNKLDVNAMGRFFPFANKEDIISNFKKEPEISYNSLFYYPKGGAIEYINSISRFVDFDKVYVNESVHFIDIHNHLAYTNKRVIHYDNLISTIPLPTLFDIIDIEYDKSLYTSNKVLVFNIGFDKKGLDTRNHWMYFPESKYPFYRIGFYDNILGGDRLSVYVEIGLDSYSEINEKELFRTTLLGMEDAGIIDNHNVVSKMSVVMNPAYVHISSDMIIDRDAKLKELVKEDIYSIGRYGKWTYSSMEDNIQEAYTLSRKLC